MRNANVLKRIIAGSIAAALLAACGGGGTSTTPPVSSGSKTQSVKVSIVVPGKNGVQLKNGKRIPLYVSRNTQGIGIDYVTDPTGFASNAPNTAPLFGIALVAGSGACPAANPDGSYTCTFYIPAVPVGYQDFKVTEWNAAPLSCNAAAGTGCLFTATGDTALSTNVFLNQVVLQNQNNALAFTLLPVVDSVALDVAPATFVDGTALTATNGARVIVKDAAGNQIIGGDQFVDKNGNTLTITIASASPAHVALSPTSFSNATSLTSTVTYDGTDVTAGGTLPNDVLFSITSPIAANINGSIANYDLLFTKTTNGVGVPAVPQVGFKATTAGAPTNIVAGPPGDANLYVVESGKVAQINSGTGAIGKVFNVTGRPAELTLGYDNDIWYLDSAGNKLGKFNPATADVTNGPFVETAAASSAIVHLAAAPDGKVYIFQSDGKAYAVSPQTMAISAAVQETPNNQTGPMTAGYLAPNAGSYDPTVCMTGLASTGCFDTLTPGTLTCCGPETGFGWNGASGANSLAIGSDHLLYLGQNGGVEAAKLNCTFSGSVGSCLVPQWTYPTSGLVQSMTTGHDGAIWFVETGAGNGDMIGRIQPGNGVQGTVNEYGAAIFGASPPGSATTPYGIALGADNNLWLTDNGVNSAVDQVVP